MSSLRLFVAVVPPDRAVQELHRAVEPLRSLPGAGKLRWTGTPGWHFTLAFLGAVDEDVLPELGERLARAAHRTEPFPLCVHGAGRFGGRVLWAGAAGAIGTLRLLAERADAAARRAGIPMEEHRRYHAHLTLARSRTDVDLRPYVEALADFEGTPWEVGELALVRSNLPGGGVPGERPRYETIASWPLSH
ncbi:MULTISPECIES: RNA 2',3'-cyclic phosphodiesterase [unclassified Streptomyces]|uniref:RNA 2',3'-cyclic phosphodiesterase n=1 Tax=unclassified Streptomyces TaxID=2593676 RepID=UPI0036EABE30